MQGPVICTSYPLDMPFFGPGGFLERQVVHLLTFVENGVYLSVACGEYLNLSILNNTLFSRFA
jgi:hypothetical protein